MIRRRNYGRNHAYYDARAGLGPDGEPAVIEVKLPGVTSIIGLQPKPWMKGWATRACADYATWHWAELAALPLKDRHDRIRRAADEDMVQAGKRGTAVHRLGELLLAGEEVDPAEPLRGHAESYRDFLDAYDVATVAAELVIGNRAVGYCGTLDVIGDLNAVHWRDEVIPPSRWLLDVKSGRGVRSASALQTCAYSRAEVYLGTDGAEHPFGELGVQRCGAVHVRADGWDLRPLDTGEITWAYFQHLAWLWYHNDFPDAWVGDEADPPALLAGTA